nr:hypothetical protein [Nanoarchaeum sp.]
MDLHILSEIEASNFKPIKLTYAIRIYSSTREDAPLELKKSPWYKRIVEYTFDVIDDEPCEPGQVSLCDTGTVELSESVARDLIMDFSRHSNGIEALMVHCKAGKERSPAVAIALNELFGLGHNREELKTKFEHFDCKAYETILRASAKRLY